MTRAATSLLSVAVVLAPLSLTAQTAAPPISMAQVSKIATLLEADGVAVALYPGIRLALGIAGNTPDLKQLTVVQHSSGVTHAIEILPSAQGYILIHKGADSFSDLFRVDVQFAERGSVRTTDAGDTSAIPADVDADELHKELLFWSMAADTLPPPKAPQPDTRAADAGTPPPAHGPLLAVQIGAFSTEAAARSSLHRLQPLGAGLAGVISVASSRGDQLYRVAVTGFASRPEAAAFCAERGIGRSACWVRTGDAFGAGSNLVAH